MGYLTGPPAMVGLEESSEQAEYGWPPRSVLSGGVGVGCPEPGPSRSSYGLPVGQLSA
jgi:hypothetical protein